MADESNNNKQKEEDIFNYLVNNIDMNIEISIVNNEKKEEESWSKCLKDLPLFTIKEIEHFRVNSGKRTVRTVGKKQKNHKHSIIKTRDRGRKFMLERYISAGDVYTKSNKNTITIKGKCKASMKRDIRSMNVVLDKQSAKVIKGHCTCPAGKSGYCNHTMALLFELADYSLQGLQVVPTEISCTSKKRQWGVPTDKQKYPLPIMSTKVFGEKNKGVACTLYDPRRHSSKSGEGISERTKRLKEALKSKDPRIGFAHILNLETSETETTKFGEFLVGSPLSYQLSLFDAGFSVTADSLLRENCIDHSYFNPKINECTDFDLPTAHIVGLH